jgi:hypothetical protein
MHTATLYKEDVTCSSPKPTKSLVTTTLGLVTAAKEEEKGGDNEFNI